MREKILKVKLTTSCILTTGYMTFSLWIELGKINSITTFNPNYSEEE